MPEIIQAQSLPVEKIKSSPYQARKNFDEQSVQSLAANLKEQGLINPITVRPLPDGTWELIAGERRLRAVKLLGWTEIDARVFANATDQDAALKGLVENLQREDLNAIERAQGYQRLANPPFNKTLDEIAQTIGFSDHQAVGRSIALLNLPQEVQDLVSRDTISERHVRALRQIPDKAKQIALAQQADKEGWSVKQTEEAVNKIVDPKGEKKGKGAKKGPMDPLADVWSKLAKDTSINACNYWTVEYKKDEWNFKASATKFAYPEDFATWFRQMAQSLSPAPIAASVPAVTDPVQTKQKSVPAPVSAPIAKPEPAKSATILVPARVAVPIPEPQEATFVSGDRMQIKWLDLGPGYSYQVMFAEDPERPRFEPVPSSPTVKTPGAIVNIFSQGQSKKVLIAVQAIDPQGHPSELSQPVEFDLKPWNKEYSVLPLPLNVMKPTAPATAAPIPVVTEAVPPTQPNKPLDPRIAALVAEHADKEAIQ